MYKILLILICSFTAYALDDLKIPTNLLLNNISPPDGKLGAVIASPSRENPDYYYHWVRDAAITMRSVLSLKRNAKNNRKNDDVLTYNKLLRNYVEFSLNNQSVKTLTDLGEPKFYVDGTAFTGPWGRPQNDGPALRAITLIEWANDLLQINQKDYVEQKLYRAELPAQTVIKRDLEYIAHHTENPSFDLWEEVEGLHFFTLMVQRKALLLGTSLALKLNDPEAARFYEYKAQILKAKILRFYNESKQIIEATINQSGGLNYKNSNLDSAVLLGALIGATDPEFFGYKDPRVIQTVIKLKSEFTNLYPINRKAGPAFWGRYPEDRYYDGNPWILTSIAYAELCYRIGNSIMTERTLTPKGSVYLKVAKELALSAQNSKTQNSIISKRQVGFALINEADQMMTKILENKNENNELAEQIDKTNGSAASAIDLTWNYAQWIQALLAKRGMNI